MRQGKVSGSEVDAGWVLMDGQLTIHVSSKEPGAVCYGRIKEILGTVEAAIRDALTDTDERPKTMTIDEYYRKMEERTPKRECSTCGQMPSCWLHDKGFSLDAVKECWTVRPVPSYVTDIKKNVRK